MTLDVIAVFLFGVLTYLGWRTGALGQMLRIAAAVAVIVAGPFAASLAREALFGETQLADPVLEVVSYFVGVTLLYVAVVAAGWLTIRAMRATSDKLTKLDRTLGAGVGAVKATLLVYVVLSGALLLWAPLKKIDPDDELHFRDGYSTATAEEYDLLSPWRIPELDAMHRMLRVGDAVDDTSRASKLRERDEDAADLLRREAVADLLADDDLMDAVRRDRYPLTLADERVRTLLNDDDFVEALGAVNWTALEDEFVEEAPEEPAEPKAETEEPAEKKKARQDAGEPSNSNP